MFAIVGSLGTELNQAIRPLLNQPRFRRSSSRPGAATFERDCDEYPWTIGWQPDYVSEGLVYGQ